VPGSLFPVEGPQWSVAAPLTSGRSFSFELVPIQALEVQHQSADPLQKTWAALMTAYALGDAVAKARQTADRFGVQLTSVEEYAAGLR
jgi:hypothetical protein